MGVGLPCKNKLFLFFALLAYWYSSNCHFAVHLIISSASTITLHRHVCARWPMFSWTVPRQYLMAVQVKSWMRRRTAWQTDGKTCKSFTSRHVYITWPSPVLWDLTWNEICGSNGWDGHSWTSPLALMVTPFIPQQLSYLTSSTLGNKLNVWWLISSSILE